jgi:hypothetical protein
MWTLTIPANATGHLPLGQEKAGSYKLDGQVLSESRRVRALAKNANGLEYELPAGSYQFEVTLP